MTIEEMKKSDKAFLVPKDVAEVLKCDPYGISVTAKTNPERLGFPVIRIGRNTKIPRIPFLRFMGVEV